MKRRVFTKTTLFWMNSKKMTYQTTCRLVYYSYSSSFSFSARKNFLDDYFSRTFNPPNLTKLTRKWWPNTGPYPDMVLSGRLTHQRIWRWSKEANLGGLQLPNLTVHDGHFEPTIEILLSWIKSQDFS